MKILNLTQHPATPEQVAAGAVEPAAKKEVQDLLTFNDLPSREVIIERVRRLTTVALNSGCTAVMIGGAGYLVTRLENALDALGIKALHAFSVRESVEEPQPDGSVRKEITFRHKGFVGQ